MKNRNWSDIEDNDVKNEYLKMPQSFSDRVDECVKEQLQLKDQRRGFRWARAAACAAVAVFIIGGTAMAATHFHLLDLIYGGEATDSEAEAFEAHVEAADDISQKVEPELPEVLSWVDTSGDQDFEEQLLQIKEIYFDGATLYVYGEATEAGKAYDLYSSRFIINGEQYVTDFEALASSQHYFQGDDQPAEDAPDAVKEMYEAWISSDKTDIDRYFGSVQLADLALTEDFTVELPLSVYRKDEGRIVVVSDGENGTSIQREYRSDGEFIDNDGVLLHDSDYPLRYNNLEDEYFSRIGRQTIAFNVSVTDNKAKIAEPQWIEIEGGRVWVNQLVMAPYTTYMKFQWYMEGEDAEERIRALSTASIKVTDENGNEYQCSGPGNGATFMETAVYEDTEGVWYTEKQLYISNVPVDVQSLTITAYVTEFDADDLHVRVGDLIDDAAFTVTIE